VFKQKRAVKTVLHRIDEGVIGKLDHEDRTVSYSEEEVGKVLHLRKALWLWLLRTWNLLLLAISGNHDSLVVVVPAIAPHTGRKSDPLLGSSLSLPLRLRSPHS
jgi:hypothetical protein